MGDEMITERYNLYAGRVNEIADNPELYGKINEYFKGVAGFLKGVNSIFDKAVSGELDSISIDELKAINEQIYDDISNEAYNTSFANPDYITCEFEKDGLPKDYAVCLCFLYAELRGIIPYAYEGNVEYVTIFGELFLEVYGMFVSAFLENTLDVEALEGQIVQDVDAQVDGLVFVPEADDIKRALQSFENDYSELIIGDRILDQLDATRDFALKIIMESDLSDLRYLYRYGEYISETEIGTAKFLSQMSDEKIKKIADTYTEGYRIGFVKDKKPLDKKETVNIRFPVGFERVVREAVKNFDKMGLKPVIYRASSLSLNKNIHQKIGYTSTSASRQFDYDHQDDRALFFDAEHVSRRLDILKRVYEENKRAANVHAGPAVIETFGEKPFVPMSKKNVLKLNEAQQKLASKYAVESGNLVNKYIIGEERSFTIIAFPIPEIGDKFEEIFDKTVELNTLDYKLYEGIQQVLIDTLDKADSVHIVGKGKNETDLKIQLCSLNDPEKETKFENCVADVNIPVGEVFTSPVLKGTNGLLHVNSVYLEGLQYKNLKIYFENGCIVKYSCANFTSVEDNEKYIKENVLFNHETLPMGEFAIGTNTTAYRMARDYGIEECLPILIGEKTGPHFAVGDTCYSRAEDVRVYNPDGKEIIAKENDFSLMRDADPLKAYFSCHTDITIPYDELGGIYAISSAGSVAIVEDGRFVLEGCEELNKPL